MSELTYVSLGADESEKKVNVRSRSGSRNDRRATGSRSRSKRHSGVVSNGIGHSSSINTYATLPVKNASNSDVATDYQQSNNIDQFELVSKWRKFTFVASAVALVACVALAIVATLYMSHLSQDHYGIVRNRDGSIDEGTTTTGNTNTLSPAPTPSFTTSFPTLPPAPTAGPSSSPATATTPAPTKFEPFVEPFVCPSSASCYYVSSSNGSDTNDGRSEAAAWRTVGKVNTAVLSANSYVMFRRGDVWRNETLTITRSGSPGQPIVYGAFGTRGERPVLTGLAVLGGWKNEGGGVFSAHFDADLQTNTVLINGVRYAMGRYPDRAFNTFESHTSNNVLVDNNLPGAAGGIDWTGAEIVIRKEAWLMDRNVITSISGTSITYSYQPRGNSDEPKDGFGYFFQNHRDSLSVFGEWFHDVDSNILYIYFGTNVDPSMYVVEAAVKKNVVFSSNRNNYFTLQDLHIRGSIDSAMYFYGWKSEWLTLERLLIEFGGYHGIQFSGCTNVRVVDNTISHAGGAGLYVLHGGGFDIARNSIDHSGLVLGAANNLVTGNGIQYAFANISWVPTWASIHDNRIDSSAYVGIRFQGVNMTVDNNYVSNSCLLLDDCSGIYTGGDKYWGRKIRGNLVVNATGSRDGATGTKTISEGIYLDEYAASVLVSDNTVVDVANFGIKLHKAHRNTIVNNVFVGCRSGAIGFENWEEAANIHHVDLIHNTFVIRPGEWAIRWVNVDSGILAFGTAVNNTYYYSNSGNQDLFRSWHYGVERLEFSFPEWQAYSNQDIDSRSVVVANVTTDVRLLVNPSLDSDRTLPLDGTYVNAAGAEFVNSVTLRPLESAVFTPS